MTLTPERIAELRRLHGRSGAPGIRGSASIRAIPELLDEIDRLREALAVKTALLDEAPKNMAKLARIAAILEPLRALEASAMPGPWTKIVHAQATTKGGKAISCRDQYGLRTHYRIPCTNAESATAPIDFGGGGLTEQDASFIAANRNALLEILRVVGE